MKHRKLLVFLAAAAVVMSSCSAFADGVKLGMLSHAREVIENMGDTQISRTAMWKTGRLEQHAQGTTYRYYDNRVMMLVALNAGEIDEILTSKIVGEYMINVNSELDVSCAIRVAGSYLAFGFREKDGRELQEKFNEALAGIRQDGTLLALTQKYCANPGKDKADSVKFENFPDAPRVRVAVTGDVPPIDYVAADGEAAGFNTAILAEIGRRLKINIETVNVDSSARTAALMSGRADAVFWYQFIRGAEIQPDAPEGVIFSDPYYDWDTFLHIRRK